MDTTKSLDYVLDPLDTVLQTVKGFKSKSVDDINSALNEIVSYTGSQEAKIAVAKTALRYNNEKDAVAVTGDLSYVAHKTKDPEAVMATVSMLDKYSEEAARGLAYLWLYLAGFTVENKRAEYTKHMIETANIMSLDEVVKTLEEYREGNLGVVDTLDYNSWNVTSKLLRFVYGTRDAKTTSELVRIISPEGDILKRYNIKTAREIARGLLAVAYGVGSLENVMTAAKIIGEYNGNETADRIARSLASIADNTGNLEAIMTAATTIGEYDMKAADYVASYLSGIASTTRDAKDTMLLAKTIGKYNKETAVYVAERLWELAHYYYNNEGPKRIIETAKTMSLDEVVETAGKYKGKAAHDIINELFILAHSTPEATVAVSKAIGKYDEERARNVAFWFGYTAVRYKNEAYSEHKEEAYYPKTLIKIANIMSLDEVVNTVGNYKGKAGEDVISGLLELAEKTKDPKAVHIACNLVNNVATYFSNDEIVASNVNKE